LGADDCSRATPPTHRPPSLPPQPHAAARRAARRPANVVALAYLALTALPLAAAALRGSAPHAVGFLAAHLAALAAGVAVTRAAPAAPLREWLADWLPLLLVPLLYAELPAVTDGLAGGASATFRDTTVIRWDAALFGTLSRDVAARAPWPALSELLHLCYLSYYAIIYVPPALLWLRRGAAGRDDAFAESVLGVTLAFAACFAAFALFPVQGPWYEWPAPAAVPDGPVRAVVEQILRAGSSRGTAFPSSHVAVATAQALLALVHQRGVGAVTAALAAGLAVGAVYGGFHYAIDVAAGAAVGGAAAALAAGISRAPGGR
jgi:membrane-associated phospholipid phosphatase